MGSNATKINKSTLNEDDITRLSKLTKYEPQEVLNLHSQFLVSFYFKLLDK
jgi:hypothetical protein